MKYNKGRLIIILIFIVSLMLNLLMAFSKKNYIWGDHFTKLITTILGVYSVHIAVIFGNIFFGQSNTKLVNVNLFTTACVICIIWNGLLLVRFFLFVNATEGDDVNELMDYLNSVSLSGSFMLVGILSYFFAKENNDHG